MGDAAKNQAAGNATNTVNDAKRLIGRSWNDDGVQKDIQHLSCTVVEGKGGGGAVGRAWAVTFAGARKWKAPIAPCALCGSWERVAGGCDVGRPVHPHPPSLHSLRSLGQADDPDLDQRVG